MALTLGITGMDSKTEADMQAAFKVANAETGHKWTLVGGDSRLFVVDSSSILFLNLQHRPQAIVQRQADRFDLQRFNPTLNCHQICREGSRCGFSAGGYGDLAACGEMTKL